MRRAWVLVAVALAWPAPASAGPLNLHPRSLAPRGNEEAAARAFASGEAAYRRADYETAATHFARAQSLRPHPSTAYNLGLAQAQAGQTTAAWETFSELARSAPRRSQRAEANAELRRLRDKVALVSVHGSPEAGVCIDGELVRAAEHPVPHAVAPGKHRLEIEGTRRNLTIEGGESSHVYAPEPSPGSDRRFRRTALGLGVISVGSAAIASGTGVGAGATDGRQQTALLATTVTFAAIAALTGVAAIATVGVKRKPKPPRCSKASGDP